MIIIIWLLFAEERNKPIQPITITMALNNLNTSDQILVVVTTAIDEVVLGCWVLHIYHVNIIIMSAYTAADSTHSTE